MNQIIFAPFYALPEYFNNWQYAVLTGFFVVAVIYSMIRFKLSHGILFSFYGILAGWIFWIITYFALGVLIPSTDWLLPLFLVFISPILIVLGLFIGLMWGLRKDFANKNTLSKQI